MTSSDNRPTPRARFNAFFQANPLLTRSLGLVLFIVYVTAIYTAPSEPEMQIFVRLLGIVAVFHALIAFLLCWLRASHAFAYLKQTTNALINLVAIYSLVFLVIGFFGDALYRVMVLDIEAWMMSLSLSLIVFLVAKISAWVGGHSVETASAHKAPSNASSDDVGKAILANVHPALKLPLAKRSAPADEEQHF